jgi:hypothetical protein
MSMLWLIITDYSNLFCRVKFIYGFCKMKSNNLEAVLI